MGQGSSKLKKERIKNIKTMAINISIPNATNGSSWNNSAQNASNWTQSTGSSMNSGQWATAQSVAAAERANELQRQNMMMAMEFNAKEAQKNRDWEETMSNTAYQRAITDMKAAGINPILAAGNGGASTPTGGAASTSAMQAHMANAYTDYENSSQGGGTSSGWSTGGSETISNISEQITSAMGALSNAFGELKGNGSTAKKVGETVEKVKQSAENTANKIKEGVEGALWNVDQNIRATKQWIKDNIGTFFER